MAEKFYCATRIVHVAMLRMYYVLGHIQHCTHAQCLIQNISTPHNAMWHSRIWVVWLMSTRSEHILYILRTTWLWLWPVSLIHPLRTTNPLWHQVHQIVHKCMHVQCVPVCLSAAHSKCTTMARRRSRMDMRVRDLSTHLLYIIRIRMNIYTYTY